MKNSPLGWLGIFRLGLVQAAIGGIVVMTTSTLNRVMVVEISLPAMLPGIVAAIVAFTMVGFGVGACGTALLVLISKRVDQGRLAAAATVTWLMMIVGFILTTVVVGKMLVPYLAWVTFAAALTWSVVQLNGLLG